MGDININGGDSMKKDRAHNYGLYLLANYWYNLL